MAKAAYSPASPYFQTKSFGNFLDTMINRPITANADDVLYEIDKVYEYRPDMLAFDMYGNASLWWVFAQRNPNTLVDPINDFVTGKKIYLPSGDTVRTALGL